MKLRIAVVCAAVAIAAGCKSKKSDGDEGPVRGTGSASELTRSAGSGAMHPDESAATHAAAGSGAGSSTASVDPKLIERGRYLTNLLGCPYCHMPMGPNGPDVSRPFAGGLEVPEVFGTWRAPNITPHKGSGIGTWTDDQVIAAVREGVRPDGSRLYPIMPYLNYNRMTDDDARALAAYLRTVKPIDNVVAPTRDLKLPQIPAPRPANLPDEAADPVKHGEYLVTMMHCNVCHTPPGKQGMPDFARAYAGGMEMELPMLGTGKLYASNITSDMETGIGKWTEADIAKGIKTMTRPDGTIIQGPMQFYLAGWASMDDKDANAIAAYVKKIPPIKHKVGKSTFKMSMHMGPPPGANGAGSATGAGSAGSRDRSAAH